MNNTKGFTLVELMAVIVLLALVMLLVLPNLSNLKTANKNRQFEAYSDMMIEYAKTVPNYKTKSYICLKDLDMPAINGTYACNGYVSTSNGKLNSYLMCKNNGEELYKTTGYNLPSGC